MQRKADVRRLLHKLEEAKDKQSENALAARVSVAADAPVLRMVSPLPGTTFLVDPDLPSSRRVPLQALGSAQLVWESDSLEVSVRDGRSFALAREGEHRLTVRDAVSGRSAETWIRVKSL